MTLGALLALCKSFSMQKSTVLCAIAAKRVKKQQTEKKIKKIKLYIKNKNKKDEDRYLLSEILQYYRVEDEDILLQRRNKYLNLINDFNERTANL